MLVMFVLQSQYFPDHVAMPLGGDVPTRFFKVEIHYDNPNMIAGNIANSGHYTSTSTPTLYDL